MPNILPQLYLPFSSNKSNYYNLPLYTEGEQNRGYNFPLIGFGIEGSANPKLLESPDEVAMRGSELVRTAFKNLKALPLEWQSVTVGQEKYLIADGHPYATEKILDKEFIKAAADTLGAELLMIGIPCRGVIIAADFVDSGIKKTIETLIVKYYNDISKTQVSDLMYIVKDGQIIDFQTIKKVEGNEEAFEESVSEDLPVGFQHSLSEMKIMNGDMYFKAMVGAVMHNILIEGCYKLILQILSMHGQKKNFTGLIEMQSMTTVLKKTRDSEKSINTFFDKLSSSTVLKQWANRYGKKIEITFLFGEDFRAGDFGNKYILSIAPGA